jgi:hypothetical protein
MVFGVAMTNSLRRRDAFAGSCLKMGMEGRDRNCMRLGAYVDFICIVIVHFY